MKYKIHGFTSEDASALIKNASGKLVHVRPGQVLSEKEFSTLIVRNGTLKYSIDKDPTMLEYGAAPKKVVPAKQEKQPESKKVVTEKDSSVASLVSQAKAAITSKK